MDSVTTKLTCNFATEAGICGKECSIKKSTTNKNPNRLYFDCPTHHFVQWCDLVKPPTDPWQAEFAANAGQTGYRVERTVQPMEVSSSSRQSSTRFANLAPEGPQHSVSDPSNAQLLGGLMNLRAELEHHRVETNTKLDQILGWIKSIENEAKY